MNKVNMSEFRIEVCTVIAGGVILLLLYLLFSSPTVSQGEVRLVYAIWILFSLITLLLMRKTFRPISIGTISVVVFSPITLVTLTLRYTWHLLDRMKGKASRYEQRETSRN